MLIVRRYIYPPKCGNILLIGYCMRCVVSSIPTPIYAACGLFGGDLSAQVWNLSDKVYTCCATSSEVDLIHPFVLVRSRAQTLLSASVLPEYQVRSRSLSTIFLDHSCGISYRAHPPPHTHAVACLARFHAALPSQPAWNDARGGVLT